MKKSNLATKMIIGGTLALSLAGSLEKTLAEGTNLVPISIKEITPTKYSIIVSNPPSAGKYECYNRKFLNDSTNGNYGYMWLTNAIVTIPNTNTFSFTFNANNQNGTQDYAQQFFKVAKVEDNLQ